MERIDLWKDHWQDEGDAAFLYKVLTEQEPDERRAHIYRRLADVEDRTCLLRSGLKTVLA